MSRQRAWWFLTVLIVALGCDSGRGPNWQPVSNDPDQAHWFHDDCGNLIYASSAHNFIVVFSTPYTGLGGAFGANGTTAKWDTLSPPGTFSVPYQRGEITLADENHAHVEYPLPQGFAKEFLDKARGASPKQNLLKILKQVTVDNKATKIQKWLNARHEYAPLGNVDAMKDWESETFTVKELMERSVNRDKANQ